MDLNNIDKDLIRKIKNHSVELDKEALWQNIQTKKKKKRGVIIYMIPLMLLFLITGSFLFSTQQQKDTLESALQTESSYSTKENISSYTVDKENTTQPIVKAEKIDKSTNNQETKIAEKKSSKSQLQKKNKSKNYIAELDNNNAPDNLENNNKSKSLAEEILSEPIYAPVQKTSQKTFPYIRHETKIDIQENNPKKEKNTAAKPYQKEQASNSSAPSLSSLYPLVYLVHEGPNYTYNLSPNVYESPIIVKEKLPAIELSLLFGMGYIDRSLSSSLSTTAAMSSLTARESSESPLEEISTTLQLSIPLTKNIYLKMGIDYSQINEKMMYSEEVSEQIILEDRITKIIIDSEGFEFNERGPVEATQISNNNFTYYNRYKSIDVPLIIGYTIPNNKWNLGLEAGIIWNSNLSFSGAILEDNNTVAENEGLFKSRTGIKYTGGISISYQLTDRWKWRLNPSYVFGAKQINTINNPVNQKYNILRVQTGLSYAF
jgi:flagellar basal body-associated protein FliL